MIFYSNLFLDFLKSCSLYKERNECKEIPNYKMFESDAESKCIFCKANKSIWQFV